MSITVHDWRTDLDRENQEATGPWWEIIYRRLWPTLLDLEIAPRGSEAQYAGVDRFVHLPGGVTLTIQEKTRAGKYDDLLIEYQHTDYAGRTWGGWIEHTGADYLLYVMPSRALCWPMVDIRRAWNMNRARWIKNLRHHKALNTGNYYSSNVAVPLNLLPPARAANIDPRIWRAI